MTEPATSVFRAFRRLALTVLWPCLLFTVVGLVIVLPTAPVTLTVYGLVPPVVAVAGAVLVVRVLDARKTPARKPDRKTVVDIARSMFFVRLFTGEVTLIVGLAVAIAVWDQTPMFTGLVSLVLLYTWWLRTDNFLAALHRVLDPVGAGQLTDAVIKR